MEWNFKICYETARSSKKRFKPFARIAPKGVLIIMKLVLLLLPLVVLGQKGPRQRGSREHIESIRSRFMNKEYKPAFGFKKLDYRPATELTEPATKDTPGAFLDSDGEYKTTRNLPPPIYKMRAGRQDKFADMFPASNDGRLLNAVQSN